MVVAAIAGLLVSGCGGGETARDPNLTPLESAMSREWVIGASGDGTSDNGRLIGMTSPKLPLVKAILAMREQGWDVDAVFLSAAEAPVQAMVQGQVDVVSVALSSVLAAAASDVDINLVAAGSRFDFVVVGDAEIGGPEGMDGRTVAYQSTISSGALAARLMTDGLPGVEPEFLTVAGTSSRISALVAGELDAVSVRVGALQEALDAGEPGQLALLYDPLVEYPFLLDTVLGYYAPHYDEETELFLQHLLLELVKSVRQVKEDPALLVQWGEEHQARSMEEPDRVVDLFFDDAGVTPEAIDQQVALMQRLGQLEVEGDLPTGDEMVDLGPWEAIKDQLE